MPGPGVANESTFHASAARPDELSYVILFHQANPRWESDGIVFAKTNIAILS